MELLYEKRRNTLFNIVYRPPNGKIEPFENLLKILYKNSNENYYIAGDFNLNSFVESTFKTEIIKSNVSDYFPICIFFLQQTYLQKIMLSNNIKESLMIKKLRLFFKISVNITGIPLKPIKMQMKLTIISY